MTNTDAQIQDLLDLYAARKNAQGGTVQFSSLRVVAEEEEGYVIDLRGTYNECAFGKSETGILARRIFPHLSFDIKNDGNLFVEGKSNEIVNNLIGATDNVVLYPHTENLQTVLSTLGVFNSTEENAPAAYILPYPYNAAPLSQFELCKMRGFYVRSPEFIDTSLPERGVLLQLPYSQYFDDSRRKVSVALLALHKMGLRLPFMDAAIGQMEGNVFENDRTRRFPDMHVPTDGRVGITTLTSYSPAPNLLVTIMEEESVVGERLQEFANKAVSLKQPNLLPS